MNQQVEAEAFALKFLIDGNVSTDDPFSASPPGATTPAKAK